MDMFAYRARRTAFDEMPSMQETSHIRDGGIMHGLRGKVAIVTGASSGIGQAIAERLGAEGARIIVDYLGTPERAEKTERIVKKAGTDAEIVKADVTEMQDMKKLVDAAWERFGSSDILINNAGVEHKSAFIDTAESDYDQVMAVNLRGPFFMTQAFVRRLRDANRPGRVVNISSVHEDMVFPGFATYCCAKGGLRMLMRDLAVELGPLGITVNNVAPGAISTPINKALLEDKPKLNVLLANIPLGRIGTPEDVAGLVAFLCSDDASYVTGSTFVIDGGLMRNYHEQ
jgi:glucose 1-dehydrogenase